MAIIEGFYCNVVQAEVTCCIPYVYLNAFGVRHLCVWYFQLIIQDWKNVNSSICFILAPSCLFVHLNSWCASVCVCVRARGCLCVIKSVCVCAVHVWVVYSYSDLGDVCVCVFVCVCVHTPKYPVTIQCLDNMMKVRWYDLNRLPIMVVDIDGHYMYVHFIISGLFVDSTPKGSF